MKKVIGVILIIMCMTVCMCSCANKGENGNEKIKVVVTAFPHYDFVRQIAGDNVDLKMLIKPGNEVHTYDPTPSDIAKISSCDIFVYTGGESDSWAKNILETRENKDMKIISFTEICPAELECMDDGHYGENEHQHSNSYDEHVWTSPVNADILALEIYKTLCKVDSENIEIYEQNYKEFSKKLAELDKTFQQIVANASRNEMVVGDRFPFSHFALEYGINYTAAFSGCSAESEPSAQTVARLADKVKNEGIPVVFTIEFSNKKVAKNIVSDTTAEILTLHSCHNVTNDEFLSNITYIELMTQNAQNLRKALN